MTTPQQIATTIAVTDTTLYTAFVDSVTRAMLISLDLMNITISDIRVDVWWENAAGSVTRYLAKDMVVPSLGSASYRGVTTLSNSSEKIRAVASLAGVDVLGTVMES